MDPDSVTRGLVLLEALLARSLHARYHGGSHRAFVEFIDDASEGADREIDDASIWRSLVLDIDDPTSFDSLSNSRSGPELTNPLGSCPWLYSRQQEPRLVPVIEARMQPPAAATGGPAELDPRQALERWLERLPPPCAWLHRAGLRALDLLQDLAADLEPDAIERVDQLSALKRAWLVGEVDASTLRQRTREIVESLGRARERRADPERELCERRMYQRMRGLRSEEHPASARLVEQLRAAEVPAQAVAALDGLQVLYRRCVRRLTCAEPRALARGMLVDAPALAALYPKASFRVELCIEALDGRVRRSIPPSQLTSLQSGGRRIGTPPDTSPFAGLHMADITQAVPADLPTRSQAAGGARWDWILKLLWVHLRAVRVSGV